MAIELNGLDRDDPTPEDCSLLSAEFHVTRNAQQYEYVRRTGSRSKT